MNKIKRFLGIYKKYKDINGLIIREGDILLRKRGGWGYYIEYVYLDKNNLFYSTMSPYLLKIDNYPLPRGQKILFRGFSIKNSTEPTIGYFEDNKSNIESSEIVGNIKNNILKILDF